MSVQSSGVQNFTIPQELMGDKVTFGTYGQDVVVVVQRGPAALGCCVLTYDDLSVMFHRFSADRLKELAKAGPPIPMGQSAGIIMRKP